MFAALAGLASSILPMIGAAQAQRSNQGLTKKLRKKLNQKANPLEVPEAFQQLLSSLNAQIDQIGGARRTQITQDFQKSLATALSTLKQRGLASSNLTANLMAGSQKKQTEAINAYDEQLMGQKFGMNQNIGLAGLNTSANERNQLTGIQGNMLNSLTQPILVPNSDPMGGLLQGLSGFAAMPPLGKKQPPLFDAPGYI